MSQEHDYRNVKKIIIHAGMPKTASSSIQWTLYKNRGFLEQLGILYETSDYTCSHIGLFEGFFSETPQDLYISKFLQLGDKEDCKKFYDDWIGRVLERAKKLETHTLVFSSERISWFDEELLSKVEAFIKRIFGESISIDVYLFTRSPISYFNSLFQQEMKVGVKPDTSNYISSVDFRNRYKETLKVYSFEESCKHNLGPVGFFLENVIGLKEYDLRGIEIYSQNEGLSDKTCDILSYINAFYPVENFDRNEFRDFSPLFKIKGNKFRLSQSLQEELKQQTWDDLCWLRNKYQIDYTKEKIQSPTKIIFDSQFLNDIIKCFDELNKYIQYAVYNYVVDKQGLKGLDPMSICVLKELECYIQKNYSFGGKEKSLQRLFSRLKYGYVVSEADVYRELAFHFEIISDYKMAFKSIRLALYCDPKNKDLKDLYVVYKKTRFKKDLFKFLKSFKFW